MRYTKNLLPQTGQQNAQLKKLQSTAATADPVPSAAYYSQPSLGSEVQSYRQKSKDAEKALKQAETLLTSMQKQWKDTEEALNFMKGYLEDVSRRYQTAPSEALASQYSNLYSTYQQMEQQNKYAYWDYLRGYEDYEGARSAYESAVTDYQGYIQSQQKQYDQWRGSIRDSATVQADLDAIDAQITAQKEADRVDSLAEYEAEQDAKPWYEKLAGYLAGVQDTTLPTYAPAATGTGGSNEDSEAMKALLEKRALLQEEYDWSKYFRYADLMNAEDFSKLSQYVSTANDQERSAMDIMMGNYTKEKSGWDDPLYEFINGNEEAGAYIANKAASAYGSDNPLGAIFGRAGESKSETRQMTQDEVAIFNYLYATEGKEAAHTYYAYLQSELNARQRQAQEAYWSEFAEESPGAASILSVATSPLKGLSYLGQGSDYLLNGSIDPNAGYNKFSYVNSTIRNEVAQKIEESGKWGKVGSFAYQTGMSMADFLTNTLISGGNSALAMTIMGSGAAADVTLEAKDRGLEDGQAFALGTIAGLAEAITEKYSLETLLDATTLGKSTVGYIVKNMLAEGSEEGASSLINLFADILISKDKSQWSQSIKAYEAQGMDEGRAFGRALLDQAAAIGLDVLGGALSGGIMAGGGVGINSTVNGVQNLQQKQQAKPQQTAVPATFQEEIQRQVTENMAGQNGAQKGTARLENMQVEIDEATFQQGQRLAQALGKDVVFYTAEGSENGYFDNGVIYINTRGNDPMLQVFSHELTHSIEGAGSYGELSRIVLAQMEQGGLDLDTARQAKMDLYARNGKKLENQAAVDQELVAEYVSKHLLTDEASILSLTKTNRSLVQRIKGWIDKTLSLFGNKNAQERVFLERARDLYTRALQQTQSSFVTENAGTVTPMGESAAENVQAVAPAETGKTAMEGGDFLESLDAQFAAGEITEEEYDSIREEYELWMEEQATASERKYSINEIKGQKENYGQGVILDTDIFDGVRPRAWGDVLSAYVYNNLAGTELTVYDGNGNSETIYLAKATDRVRKDGAKNSHKVLDKLAGYRGDSVRAKAIVQMSEVLATSKYENSIDEHSHQWMDENGWILRKTYLQTLDGDIYEATLNIADGRDRKILYEINQVHWVDKKETSASIPSTDNSQRSRYQEPGMGGAQSEVYADSVPNTEQKVKGNKGRQYSISEETVSKKDVASDLRAILKRGGDIQELKRYVAQLERSGGKTEQKGASAEQKGSSAEQNRSEAERILKNAKRQGITVGEYLQQNWEQYDQDGQWNADARKALEMEKRGKRQFSISEGDAEADAEAKPDIRSTMPKKALDTLKRVERELLWKIADKLSVPKLAGREYLQPIIQEMSDEYLKEGTISQERMDLLFEKAYAQAVIVDAEFFDQYKHIKDHLRNTSVTISDRDKADIADFGAFRKRAFGTLRIVNEGGMPVNSAYHELQELAPELFPESITHPADQLQRMYDAARSIQVTEKTVQDYYGEHEPEYRRWARADFEAVIQDATGVLWEVKRYAEDKAAKESESAPVTEAEAMQVFKDMKKARRDYERVSAKNLLTEHDQIQVGRLLRHELELEHLDPEKDNVKGITAVYEAKKEYDRLCKLVGEYKRHLRGKARKEADALLETANSWKDKKAGIAYSRETMERNIFDIIKDKKLAQQVIDKYFAPVHMAEAAATRFKNDYRDRVRALDLSRKVAKGNLVSEAHAVQLLGEAEDNIRMLENARGRIKDRDGKTLSEWKAVVEKLWAENPNLDKGKIEKAVKEFRYIYDALFQKMNQVRVANGYEPVNYRNGYFPHFQPGDSDSVLALFGRALGIDTRIDALPTTINGLTHTFKPGIQWFGNAQERLGFNTAYDAVEGFDKYIEGVASVIYHTTNIQNLRAFASQIRYRTSDEGIRKQVDEINARTDLTEAEKQVQITDVYAHGKFTLSNFVTELDEYTNLLANKKSRYDRAIEAAMERRVYTFLKAWEARVGANMIAGNLTSALTNFIPLTQAGAQMDRFALLNGMWNTLQSYRADDGMVGMSTFLTNRRGSDPLVQTWSQKASGVLGKPMEWIDGFVSESIVRGAYYQNIKRGMSTAEAMNQADAFGASVMADRSKGAMPTMLQASNPLFKAFTQFQLEVNNQFSEVFKDIPRRFKEKGLAALAWVLLKYFLGAFLYNELYEELIGRRPALDPIGMLCEAYDDLQNDGFGEAAKNLATNALDQLPFSSGLTLVGVELDGGRIPASSAVPDFTAIWDAATTEGWSAKKRWKEIQDELNKLAYVATPFGGNQVSKIWKGVKAYIQGGSYTVDAEGNDILQYPVYKDETGDAFWNLVRAAFLGKSSLPEAQNWVDSNFDSMSAKQTAAYQDMIAAGIKDRDAYALVQEVGNAQKTDTQSKAIKQIGILRKSEISAEGKAIVYYGLVASEKEQGLMDSLADMGADTGAVLNALMGMREANTLTGIAGTIAKYEAIKKAALTDEEKSVLVGSIMGTDLLTDSGGITQYAKFQYAIQNGMSVDEFISYRNTGANIDYYLKLRDAGASVEEAMETGIALKELNDSIEDPTTVQKWRTVIDSTNDVQTQLISLSVVMTDSQYRKIKTAHNFGISPSTYVRVNELLPKYDADGNKSYTQEEVTKAINAMGGTVAEKAALWQLVTGASSAKNNPYSTEIGQKVIDAIDALKDNEQQTGLSFEEEILRQIMGG